MLCFPTVYYDFFTVHCLVTVLPRQLYFFLRFFVNLSCVYSKINYTLCSGEKQSSNVFRKKTLTDDVIMMSHLTG